MFGQIKNSNNEKLFILAVNSTNCIEPYIKVSTWEGCLEVFNKKTIETDNDQMFIQLIHKEIDEMSAKASTRCNKKGWGVDYFEYLTIKPLYSDKA